MFVRKRTYLCLVLTLVAHCLGWPGPARADFMYTFTADTSSVTGQTGSLDIQFNGLGPGGTDTAVISSFSSVGGILGSDPPAGDVIGDLGHLPATFTDDTPFNDLNPIFTFGSNLQFTVILTTNNLSPGATFAFTIYDGSGNPVDVIAGNFDAVEIDVDAGGNPESPLTGSGVSGAAGLVSTPAPASAVLLAVGAICLAVYRRLRKLS